MGAIGQSRCREMDPEIFFPTKGANRESIDAAKAICQGCPLSAFKACATRAVENGELAGIWAGEHLTVKGEARSAARRRLEEISGLTWPTERQQRNVEQLTKWAVIKRMSETGHSAAEIAIRTGVSDRTVVRHRAAS